MKTKFPLALAAILHITSFAFAQQPTSTPPPAPSLTARRPATVPQQPAADDGDVVRITTNLVQTDAVVTDKNGKPVKDLRPDEVQIFEGGRRQTITHFSYVVAGSGKSMPAVTSGLAPGKSAAPVPLAPLQRDQVRRTIALVVDDLGLSIESTHFVRQALRKFVDEQLQPGDLVAILRTGSGMGALQQFTADKRLLYAAIDRVKWNPMGRASGSSVPDFNSSAIAGALPARQEAEADAFMSKADSSRTDLITGGTLGSLAYVVHGLGELPGRKSILLISDGFPAMNAEQEEQARRLCDLANRASVVIYSMDARGLQTLTLTASDNTRLQARDIPGLPMRPGQRSKDFHDQQGGLNYLAEQTGGLFVHNRNDLNDGLQSIMEDQQGYYLVAYRPDESTFDPRTGARKFHALTLKVTRPGKFNVRMRKGFYGVTEVKAKPELQTASQRVINALTSPFGAAGVHVRLTSAYSNDTQLGSLLSSMLHVRGSDLTFNDEPNGWHRADFDIVAVTYGDNGRVVDQVGHTHSIRFRGDTYQSMLKDGFVYIVTVPVKKPGAYQLRVALRDHGSERIGSASQFVEVPDLTNNNLTLSSVLVSGVELAALPKKEAGAKANQASPDQNGEREEVNHPKDAAAVRQFHHGTILQYGFAMYNARLDKTTGRPQLQIKVRILRDGLPVFTGQEEAFELKNQSDLKRLGASGGIQLGSKMAPGEYVFQVIVTDRLADPKHRVATQWIDFEIIE